MRFAIAAVGIVAACTSQPGVELDPLDPYGEPPAPVYLHAADGSYDLETRITIEGSLDHNTFESYVDAPGATLLAVADAADLPALTALELAHPGITANLAGWYNESLASNGLAILTAWPLSRLTQFVTSDATIRGSMVIANGSVTYTLDSLSFDERPAITYELGLLDGEITSAELTATTEPTTQGGNIYFALHDVQLAYGHYAFDDTMAEVAETVASLRQLTACPLVGATVAGKCANNACVAQIPLFVELCERGLDEVFAQSRRELASAFSLKLTGGTAGILTDRLEGLWSSDAGTGAEQLWTTFTARRL